MWACPPNHSAKQSGSDSSVGTESPPTPGLQCGALAAVVHHYSLRLSLFAARRKKIQPSFPSSPTARGLGLDVNFDSTGAKLFVRRQVGGGLAGLAGSLAGAVSVMHAHRVVLSITRTRRGWEWLVRRTSHASQVRWGVVVLAALLQLSSGESWLRSFSGLLQIRLQSPNHVSVSFFLCTIVEF